MLRLRFEQGILGRASCHPSGDIHEAETILPEPDDILTEAPRCVLAVEGEHGPFAVSVPFWWDGSGLWMAGTLVADAAALLRRRPAASALVVSADPEAACVVVRGRARVHGLHDPLGLALHGPAVTAALGALAVKTASELPALARDIPQIPVHNWPDGLVAVRLAIDQLETSDRPETGRGMGPALPSTVPPPVRRAVSGRRDVVVAVSADATKPSGAPDVLPAVWSVGFRLDTVVPLPDGAAATAVVDVGRVGLALDGEVDGGRLAGRRARWWQGLLFGSADVPSGAVRGIELPD